MSMLDFLKGFSTLRRETLSPIDSDDVDEIRVEKAGVKTLYAQREGDKWTDEKHRPVKADVAAFLIGSPICASFNLSTMPRKRRRLRKI